MATLQETTTTSLEAPGIYIEGSGMTQWYKFYHCLDAENTSLCNPTYSCNWIHIRTPIPANATASGIGWNPSMIQVIGFHTYSAELWHDYSFVINTTGDGNDNWYGSQIRVNKGNTEAPVVYRSTNTYGGFQRVCITMRKYPCCCVGWYWVRFRNSGAAGYRNNFAWAQLARNSSAAVF